MSWMRSSAGNDGHKPWKTLKNIWRSGDGGAITVVKQTGEEVANLVQLLVAVLQNSAAIINNDDNRRVCMCDHMHYNPLKLCDTVMLFKSIKVRTPHLPVLLL